MADERLRALERAWKESGSVADEAAYLRERVRVGDLMQERLELAAYCMHQGARAALGPESAAPPANHGLVEWAEGLPSLDDCIRASVIAVRCARKPGPFQQEVDVALRAAEKWLLEHGPEALQRVVLASPPFRHRTEVPDWFEAAGRVCDAIRAATRQEWLAREAALSALRTLEERVEVHELQEQLARWALGV